MKVNLDNVEEKEILPGFFARMIHGENMTLAYWEIQQNAILPEHNHIHEQTVNMLAGQFQMTIDGEEYVFGPGDIFVIPPDAVHSGKALTNCKILDVFSPTREDYK